MSRPAFRSERLAKHDRSGFSCGVPALDNYFHERVNQDQRRSLSVAYVLIESVSELIVGYFTLSSSTVGPSELLPEIARKLPRYAAYGAILIGRLAVDRRYQGRGFGRRLLFDASNRCLLISRQSGAYAVLVEAKDASARAFYEHVGFHRLQDDELHLFIPMVKIALLFPSSGSAAQ